MTSRLDASLLTEIGFLKREALAVAPFVLLAHAFVYLFIACFILSAASDGSEKETLDQVFFDSITLACFVHPNFATNG